MRNTCSIIACASLLACAAPEPVCSSRPTDPTCVSDVGPGDTGTHDAGGASIDSARPLDAHQPCNGTCSGSTPYCLMSGGSEYCVGCTGDADCAGTGGPHCDPTRHRCVDCLAQSDCTDPTAPVCDADHVCVPCTMSSECAHLTATPACSSSRCVECNSNADCDATHGCVTSTHTCVAITPLSAQLCDPCLRDSECQAGQLCLEENYHGLVGSFCTWRQDATGTGAPNGDCLNVRPARSFVYLDSTDGTGALMCILAASTCAALRNFGQACSPATAPTSSAMCGPNMDGFCQTEGALTECTVDCYENEDCPCTDDTCASQYACIGGFCSLSATCNWDTATQTCH